MRFSMRKRRKRNILNIIKFIKNLTLIDTNNGIIHITKKNKNRLKNYYEVNKESILQRINERYTCGCGSENSHCNRRRHERSFKHIAWLKDQQQTAETIQNYFMNKSNFNFLYVYI